jgi:SARP family transcriptional regulator, regulator of embCAB operon
MGAIMFGVLGPLEVIRENRKCTPTAPKVCRALALLLLRANYVVSTDALIGELWGEDPPRSAVTTTQTYIYQLRKSLDEDGSDPTQNEILVTRPPGYILRVGKDQLDAGVSERLVSEGAELLDAGEPERAGECLHRALGLWRGSALANIDCGTLLEAHAAHLDELRIRATELRIQADMELGKIRALIPELRSLVATYPLNEWFHEQLMIALARSGRRGDALEAYQDVRRVLGEDLGLDPNPRLQALQQAILASGTASASGSGRNTPGAGAVAALTPVGGPPADVTVRP